MRVPHICIWSSLTVQTERSRGTFNGFAQLLGISSGDQPSNDIPATVPLTPLPGFCNGANRPFRKTLATFSGMSPLAYNSPT